MITAESMRGRNIKSLTLAEKEFFANNLMLQIARSLSVYAAQREAIARAGK